MMPDKMKEFITTAKTVLKETNYIYCCLTQAYHESAGFKRVIGSQNYWGIKKSATWKGKVHEVQTWEVINQKKITCTDFFIDFDTCTEAITWWDSLIQRLYQDAYMVRNEPYKFFEHLEDKSPDYPGDPDFQYATDPVYVPKLKRIYDVISKNQEVLEMLK